MTLPTGNPIGRPRKLTPEQEAEVYAALGRESARKLAERLGVERGTVYATFHRERRRRRA